MSESPSMNQASDTQQLLNESVPTFQTNAAQNLTSINISPSLEDIIDLVDEDVLDNPSTESKVGHNLTVPDESMDELSLGGDTSETETVEVETGIISSDQNNGKEIEGPVSATPEKDLVVDQSLQDIKSEDSALDITKYFQNEPPPVIANGADFFNNIGTPSVTEDDMTVKTDNQKEGMKQLSVFDTVLQQEDSSDKKDGSQVSMPVKEHKDDDLATKIMRSTSRCSAEVEVSFEAEPLPGAGEIKVPEDEGVKKFFKEDALPSNTDDKEFFDSFTAEKSGDDEVTSSSQIQTTSPKSIQTERHDSGDIDPYAIAPGSPIHVSIPLIEGKSPHESSLLSSVLNQSPISPRRSSENSDPGADKFIHAFQDSEDTFSASLKMSDSDRQHDAWIPADIYRQVFITIATNPPGMFVPAQEHLTMPGILVTESQGDPVKELVYRFMGEHEASKRQILTVHSVSQDDNGLRELIKAESFRAAIDLTGKLLKSQGQGTGQVSTPTQHSPNSLQVWFVRIALLVKLRLYSVAESECQTFGNLDRPDLYYEFYPDIYPGRKGSMVPFAFRVLHAEIPAFLGKAAESLDRLYYLHAITKKIMNNLESGYAEDGSMIQVSNDSRQTSRHLWESRAVQLLYSIGNRLLSIKEYHLSVVIFETLAKKDEQNASAIWSAMGRIYLQVGDIGVAQTCFGTAEQLLKETDNKAKCMTHINRGFVSMGLNNFNEARQHFKDASDLDPENAIAVNNMAVCFLYIGKLSEALIVLEELVHRNPTRYIQDGILFNLSTLYELESSRAMHKKQTLLDLVSKYKGDGFNTACLKMT